MGKFVLGFMVGVLVTASAIRADIEHEAKTANNEGKE